MSTKIRAFFRRPDWHGTVASGRAPLWHRFEKMVDGVYDYGDGVVIKARGARALCGYTYVRSHIDIVGDGASIVDWRDDIKTAKLRCKKCDAAFEKETADAAGATI